MMPHFALSLALCFAAAAAPAQDEGLSQADEIRVQMKVLQSRRSSLEQKVPAMQRMLTLGIEGPRQLAVQLAKDAKNAHARYVKERRKLEQAFDRLGPRIVKRRIDTNVGREMETLRETIRAGSRDSRLTKQWVKENSDPALSRLTEILTITPNDVYDFDEDRFDELASLLDDLEVQNTYFQYWSKAFTRLQATEEGKKRAGRLKEPFDPGGEEQALLDSLMDRTKLASPMLDMDRKILEANRELAEELDPEEARGIKMLNMMRIYAGLGALRIDLKLCNAARDHSQDMLRLGFFSHKSPVEGKESFGKRAALAGTSASAENIAAGQSTGKGAIDAWWYSPGHHRNMLAGHARVGLGRHVGHWTQLFGR